jgi:Sigma-70 region 2
MASTEACNLALSFIEGVPSAVDLAALVGAYSALLFRIAYSVLRSRTEAEDVVQDVFIRVLMTSRLKGFIPQRKKPKCMLKCGRLHIIGKANQQTKDFTARQQDIRAKMQGGSTGVLSPESLKNYFDSTPAGFYVPKNWVWGS